MDILIKRKNYKEALDFLYEKSIESDWNFFNEALNINRDFLEYFKNFLVNLNCVLRLKTFLLKIFCTKKDKKFQEIVYEIISDLNNSQSEFSQHILIKNLLLVQTVKLVVLDQGNRSRLEEIIKSKSINDDWFIELLESFQYWTELGLFYEIRGDYEKCLEFYKKTDTNEEKVKELMQLINLKDNVQVDIKECEEEQYYECEKI